MAHSLADHVRRESVEEAAGKGCRPPRDPSFEYEAHRQGGQRKAENEQQVECGNRPEGQHDGNRQEAEQGGRSVGGQVDAIRVIHP